MQKALKKFFRFYSDCENNEDVVKQFVELDAKFAFYIYDQVKYNLDYHEAVDDFFKKLEAVEKKEVESIKSSFIELGLLRFEAYEPVRKRSRKAFGNKQQPAKIARTTAEIMKSQYLYRHIDVDHFLQDEKPDVFQGFFGI